MVPTPFFRNVHRTYRDEAAMSWTFVSSSNAESMAQGQSLEQAAPMLKQIRRSVSTPASTSRSQLNSPPNTERRGMASTVSKAKGRPSLRKSTSALSSLSLKSVRSRPSTLPPELAQDALTLQPKFWVSVHAEAGIDEVFDFREKLGEGGFGKVWLAKHKETGNHYAVKIIDVNSIADANRFEAELKVFERLSNRYIVALRDVFREDKHLYLIMDLCTGGDLRNFLMGYWRNPVRAHARLANPTTSYGLPWELTVRFMWQMLSGIMYMHHHRFMHRDIKLSNFMLKDTTDEAVVQLVDFGLSTTFTKGLKMSYLCGTLSYMAPEVLKRCYNEKADIWGIGIAGYVLCLERSPWPVGVADDVITSYILGHKLFGWPAGCPVPQELRRLIATLLIPNPEHRPSAKETLMTNAWLRLYGGGLEPPPGCCTLS